MTAYDPDLSKRLNDEFENAASAVRVPHIDYVPDDSAGDVRPSRFQLEFLPNIVLTPVQWLLGNIAPRTGLMFIAGASGALKTFFAIDICMRAANEMPVLGHPTIPTGVVYVAAEDATGVRMRLLAWQERYRGSEDNRVAIIGNAPDLRDPGDVSGLVTAIKSACEQFRVIGLESTMVVIDTMSQTIPGADENATKDMSIVVAKANMIAKETDCLVNIVHHCGKDAKKGMRGSTTLFAAADAVIMLSAYKDKPVVHGLVDKVKNGPRGQVFAMRLEPVEFQHYGKTYSSCTLEYIEAENQVAKIKKPTANDNLVLSALNDLIDHGPTHPEADSPDVPRNQHSITRDQLRERLHQTGFTDGEAWLPKYRVRLADSLKSLKSLGLIRTEGDSIWPV